MTNFFPLIPEIFVLSMACLALLLEAFLGKRVRWLTYAVVQLTLLVAALLTWGQMGSPAVTLFEGMFIQDKLSLFFKEFIYLSAFLSFLYSRAYLSDLDNTQEMPRGEFYLLGLFSVLGMMLLISGNHLLTLFLGLELFSLPIYAMVALRRSDGRSSEAAIKYFVMGALASGILLYGFSMLFGGAKALDLPSIAAAMGQIGFSQASWVWVFALVFILVGLSFKLGAAPFHMWVPDVYQGAPSAATLFLSTVPKIAGLALFLRLLTEAMPSAMVHWQQMLIVVSILSMAVGNLTAIVQSNIKRMLAYSSIAHMGYMLLGLIAGTKDGYAAATFYMMTYVLMTLGAFGMIVLLSRSGIEIENLEDFKGLSRRNPWLAFVMMLLMFSMAGIPPLVGFMAKLGVLEALVREQFIWLAAVALVFAIVGAYYYIRLIKLMYFDEPEVSTKLNCPSDIQAVLVVNGLGILMLGIFPGILFSGCRFIFE